MGKTAVVFSCGHAMHTVSNERFSWLGQFIYDVRPDYVVDLGDGADMRSLSTYENSTSKGPLYSYEKDINAYLDAQERLRLPFKKGKKKRPSWYGFEGNHEYRIKKALMVDPRLEGPLYGLSFSNLNTDKFFDEYWEYENKAPAIHTYDGVAYAHYFTTSNSPAAISGQYHGEALLRQLGGSATCGHSHKRNIAFKDGAIGGSQIGLVAGCFKGAEEDWAGQSNKNWWHGVIVKNNIENGSYSPQFISLEELEKYYGST